MAERKKVKKDLCFFLIFGSEHSKINLALRSSPA